MPDRMHLSKGMGQANPTQKKPSKTSGCVHLGVTRDNDWIATLRKAVCRSNKGNGKHRRPASRLSKRYHLLLKTNELSDHQGKRGWKEENSLCRILPHRLVRTDRIRIFEVRWTSKNQQIPLNRSGKSGRPEKNATSNLFRILIKSTAGNHASKTSKKDGKAMNHKSLRKQTLAGSATSRVIRLLKINAVSRTS